MKLSPLIALGIALVAALACGGHTSESATGDGGGACPDPSQVTYLGTCEGTLTCPSLTAQCGGEAGMVECQCEDGTWQCFEGEGCPADCPAPSDVIPGASCNVIPSESCAAAGVPSCSDATEGGCVCQGGSWQCAAPSDCDTDAEAGASGNGCPSPAALKAGVSCGTPDMQCAGNPQVCGGASLFDTFECEHGAWRDVARAVCDVDGSAVDAGTSD